MAYDRGKLEQLALELENEGRLHDNFQRFAKEGRPDRDYRDAIYDTMRKSCSKVGADSYERAVLHRHLARKWGVKCKMSERKEGYPDLYPDNEYDPVQEPEPVKDMRTLVPRHTPTEVLRASDIPWERWKRLQAAAQELELFYRGWDKFPLHARFDRIATDMRGGHRFERVQGFTGGTDLEVILVVRHLDGVYPQNGRAKLPDRADLAVDVDLFPLSHYTGSGASTRWHSGKWKGAGGKILPDWTGSSTGRMAPYEPAPHELPKIRPAPEGAVNLYPYQKEALDRLVRGSQTVSVTINRDDRDDATVYGITAMRDQIVGHLQKAASHFAKVDAAFAQTTGKPQSQTSPALGKTLESNMNAINIKTITTNSTNAKENNVQTLVNGADIKTLGTNQIYALISDSETLIETLSKIKNKPMHLQAEIDAHKAGIDALVKHLDERYLAENPDAVVAKPAAKRRAAIKVEPKAQEGATPAAE